MEAGQEEASENTSSEQMSLDETKPTNNYWTPETELHLFDKMEVYPPFGLNKFFNLVSLSAYIEKMTGVKIPCHIIWEHFNAMFNMEILAEEDRLWQYPEPVEFHLSTTVILTGDVSSDGEQRKKEDGKEKKTKKTKKKDAETKKKDKDEPSEDDSKAASEAESEAGSAVDEEEEQEEEEEGEKKAAPAKAGEKRKRKEAATSKKAAKKQKTDEEEEKPEGEEEVVSKNDQKRLLEQKKAKLDDVYEKVMVQKKGRFSSFTEFLYGALRALGEPAELQSIYDWVAKNWKLLEPKYAEKFEKEKALNYKSNIRSTLYSNLLFEKLEEKWAIVRLDAPPKAKKKRRNRK